MTRNFQALISDFTHNMALAKYAQYTHWKIRADVGIIERVRFTTAFDNARRNKDARDAMRIDALIGIIRTGVKNYPSAYTSQWENRQRARSQKNRVVTYLAPSGL